MKCARCFAENSAGATQCRECSYSFTRPRPHAARERPERPAEFLAIDVEAPPPQGGFFSFRSLITPALIRAIYAIGALLMTAIGSVTILFGADILESEQMAGWFFMPMPILEGPADAVWLGLVILIAGNLVWRVICEVGLVLFNIYDRLASIESRLRRPLTERHDVRRRK